MQPSAPAPRESEVSATPGLAKLTMTFDDGTVMECSCDVAVLAICTLEGKHITFTCEDAEDFAHAISVLRQGILDSHGLEVEVRAPSPSPPSRQMN